jgi:hypothetical protein
MVTLVGIKSAIKVDKSSYLDVFIAPAQANIQQVRGSLTTNGVAMRGYNGIRRFTCE